MLLKGNFETAYSRGTNEVGEYSFAILVFDNGMRVVDVMDCLMRLVNVMCCFDEKEVILFP